MRAEAGGLLGSRAAAQSEKAESAFRSVASKAEFSDDGETASLSFALSEQVPTSAFVLSDPDRVIVELPAVSFQIDPQTGKRDQKSRNGRAHRPTRLVSSFRFGSFAPGRSRVVIDLDGPARILRSEIQKDPDGGYKLVVQLGRTDRAAFRAAAQAARSQMSSLPPPSSSPPSSSLPSSSLPSSSLQSPVADRKNAPAAGLPLIMIDPGHGGIDSGAMVGGLIEKTIVLDFAKALAARLRATGRYDVALTRGDDTFISLGERVRMARHGEAALFISIHADTLNETDVTGATVYTISDRASDLQAAHFAEKENQSDLAAGVEAQEEASGVSDILFDLTRRETRSYSHVFAHTLTSAWKAAARLNKNPERSAGFKVLTAPDVPSVLLELGYLSNEKDAAALASPEWREKSSEQVAQAIESFFDARGKGPVAQASEPTLLSQMKPQDAADGARATH